MAIELTASALIKKIAPMGRHFSMLQRAMDAVLSLSRKQIAGLLLILLLLMTIIVSIPVRAAVVFRSASSASNGNGTTSLVIPKPTGLQVGDLMIANITQRATNGFTHPSGWTYLGGQSISGQFQMQSSYKIATSTDVAATDFTWIISTATKAAGGITAYSGVDTSSPIGAWNSNQGFTSLSGMDTPFITTARNNSVIVAAFAQPLQTTFTADTGTTQRFQVSSSGGGSTTSKVTIAAAEKTVASANTSTSMAMATSSTDGSDYMSTIVSINPAAPATLTQSAYRWFTNVDGGNFSNVTTNPTTGTDAIYAAVNDSTYMYTAGYYSSNGNDWRIEKRNLSDGALVSGFGSSGVVNVNVSANDDRAWGIDQDASNLYIVGQDATVSSTNTQWRIEKRDKTTGGLVSGFGSGGVVQLNQTSGLDIPKEVKVDGSYVYVAGFDNTGAGAWRIEKRDITTGALVSGFGSGGAVVVDYEATENDEIAAMVIDSSSIYVGGFDYASGVTNSQIRIEKRDKTTGALVSGFGSGGAVVENPFTGNSGSTIDDGVVHKGLVLSGGNLYIAASQGVTSSTDFQWRIAKRDATTGALVSGFGSGGVINVNPGSAIDNPTTIRTDGSSLFVAGFDRTLDSSMSQWRIEKRDMTSGALVSGFGTSGVVTSNPSTNHDEVRDMVVSGNNIYPAGYDVSPGNYQMRIEKRNTVTGNGPSDDNSPRAALNTSTTSVAVNDKLRLRMLLRVGTNTLGVSDQQLKLQYAVRSGTCDASFTGETYADVTTTTDIAYHNNTSLADASAAYFNINDPTDGANPVVIQSYEEANNFTNGVAAVPVNSNGLWDFSLYNRSAPLGTTYCFRAVDSGGTVLASYANMPELSTPPAPTYEQGNYRWYQNADSLNPGAPLANQSTAATIAVSTPFRLRQLISQMTGSTAVAAKSMKLQYAEKSGTCDTSFSGETYNDFYVVQSTGAQLTGTSINEITVGGGLYSWSSPASIYADDGSRAGVTSTDTSVVNSSNILQVRGYGFSIPSNATITGVEVTVEESGSGGGSSYIDVRLTANSTSSTFKGGTTNLVTVAGQVFTYGSSTDTWGLSLTPADVNNTNFSADIQARVRANLQDGSVGAYADYVGVNVYYTLPTNNELQLYNNAAVTDGDIVTSSGSDPVPGSGSTVLQAYVETMPFNTAAQISQGENGLWDFSLTSSGSAANKTYCLRTVNQDGNLLNSYGQIPEISIGSGGAVTPTLNQMLRGGQSVIDGVKRGFLW